MNFSAFREDLFCADDPLYRPVAALDEYIGVQAPDQFQRSVFVKGNHGIDALQRGEYCQAVFDWIYRAVAALVQAPYRCVGVDGYDEAGTQCPGFLEVRNMPAVEDVEAAVGKHQWCLECLYGSDAGRIRLTYFFTAAQEMISNTLTTRLTPPTLRATAVAWSASAWLTSPIR